MGKTRQLAWRASSYGHDWRALGLPERLLAGALAAGAIGPVEKLELGDDFEPGDVAPHEAAAAPRVIAEALWAAEGPCQVRAAGRRPLAWEATLSFLPRPPDAGPSVGSALLTFEPPEAGPGVSDALWSAFRATHRGDDTSYAFVHPRKAWVDVRDREPPLVNSATFQTTLWANYVGPDLLAQFRREELADLEAHSVEWTEDGGLFLRLSAALEDAVGGTRSAIESRRRALAARFRKARRY